jgi:aspartate kinase
MKFGGTSVGSVEAVKHVIQITRDSIGRGQRVVHVASALSGATNQLLQAASLAAQGDREGLEVVAAELEARHKDMAAALILDRAVAAEVMDEVRHLLTAFVNWVSAIHILGEATPRVLDMIACLGERMSIRLLAGALAAAGIQAQPVESAGLIITDNNFQAARPDMEATRAACQQQLLPMIDDGIIPVITGFMSSTPAGTITTLGRGGSDYSAAILGVSLDAEEVWIWTDVDGVMSADPRRVPAAYTIPSLSFKEVAELAYFGARVLHPRTIRPVIEAGIAIRVLNTFNSSHPGTVITTNGQKPVGVIKAVTTIDRQQLITIEGRGMLGVPGVAARAFGAVAETETNVILISQASSEQSISFSISSEATARVVNALERMFAAEIERRDIDRVWSSGLTTIVTVVGAGMRETPGVAGKVLSALGHARVNVIAIAQGSSEAAISMVVQDEDAGKAVRCIHETILEG